MEDADPLGLGTAFKVCPCALLTIGWSLQRPGALGIGSLSLKGICMPSSEVIRGMGIL